MLAIERGIAVYGASSMGALRAAELSQFGMQGIGEIFDNYRHGHFTDDEVALLHEPGMSDYKSLSVPMVNICATVAVAIKCHLLDYKTADIIIQTVKNLFYPHRTFEKIGKIAIANGVTELKEFLVAISSAMNQHIEIFEGYPAVTY